MQDNSYIYVSYVSGMVLSNPEITPSSHNLKHLKNDSGQFPVQRIPIIQRIPIKSRIQYLFFASCLFCFASVKSALTTLSAI